MSKGHTLLTHFTHKQMSISPLQHGKLDKDKKVTK